MIEILKRKLSIIRKRSGKLRHILPASFIKGAKELEDNIVELSKKNYYNVRYNSKYVNVYHFALQKTGTQWLSDVLADPCVYVHSGLSFINFHGVRRKSQTHELRGLNSPYPPDTIISSIAGTYDNYAKDIPKNEGKNALFFVIRDPREMVVSWYFSTKNNHIVRKKSMLNIIRKKLLQKSKKKGLLYTIDLFDWKGKFDVMRSWLRHADNNNVKIVKFEDLIHDSINTFNDLFCFLDIRIPNNRLEQLVFSYSFEALTGRKKGREDRLSHMRAGHSNSWKKHFDPEIESFFNRKAEDVVDGFSY